MSTTQIVLASVAGYILSVIVVGKALRWVSKYVAEDSMWNVRDDMDTTVFLSVAWPFTIVVVGGLSGLCWIIYRCARYLIAGPETTEQAASKEMTLGSWGPATSALLRREISKQTHPAIEKQPKPFAGDETSTYSRRPEGDYTQKV